VTAQPAFLDDAAWYAQLPTLYGAAGALITDRAGDVLLVKPNYRDYWTLPGGVLEHGEPPHLGCAREVAEETGLAVAPGPLLVIDWAPPDGVRPRPFAHFPFDGGTLTSTRRIRLQAAELDAYRLTRPADVARFTPPFLTARISAALRARDRGSAVYLPAGSGWAAAPSPGPLPHSPDSPGPTRVERPAAGAG
jgi:8-oxo-dGTP diphosphatase